MLTLPGWIFDDPAGSTSAFHSSLAGSDGADITDGGVTFTLFGTGLDSRDRGLSDAMLSDFVFRDASNGTVETTVADSTACGSARRARHPLYQ